MPCRDQLLNHAGKLVVVARADGEGVRGELVQRRGTREGGEERNLRLACNLGAGYRARSGDVAEERERLLLVDEVEGVFLGFCLTAAVVETHQPDAAAVQ